MLSNEAAASDSGGQRGSDHDEQSTRLLSNKTRGWIVAAICFVAVVLVIGIALRHGTRDSATVSIERVLVQDDDSTRRFDADVNNGVPVLAALQSNVQRQDALDLSDCPDDFAQAYLRHRTAWRLFLTQVQMQPQTLWQSFIRGIVDNLSHNIHDFPGENKECLDAITKTWADVESAAARHGAKIPHHD